MAINFAEKYSNAVDEAFSLLSVTDRAVNNDFDFTGAKTVKVYDMPTAPMGDYTTSGANRYGTPSELQDDVQELTLSRIRSFTFTLDKINSVDTPEGVRDAGKALARQLSQVVIPEIDIYRLAAMGAGAGANKTLAITKDNAYETFLDAQNALREAKAPIPNRIAYVSPNFTNASNWTTHLLKPVTLRKPLCLTVKSVRLTELRLSLFRRLICPKMQSFC